MDNGGGHPKYSHLVGYHACAGSIELRMIGAILIERDIYRL